MCCRIRFNRFRCAQRLTWQMISERISKTNGTKLININVCIKNALLQFGNLFPPIQKYRNQSEMTLCSFFLRVDTQEAVAHWELSEGTAPDLLVTL